MRDNNTIFTAATVLFEEKVFPKCQTSKDSHGDIPIWDDEPDFPNLTLLWDNLLLMSQMNPMMVFHHSKSSSINMNMKKSKDNLTHLSRNS